jgi:sodium bicarbonate transporter 10
MIAIVLASAIDFSMGLSTQKLDIPTKFEPTTPSARGWLIAPFGKNSVVTIFLAIIPAMIATILVFMDQQITAVIVNRKEFKLKKSNGYHLDLFIVAVSIAVCSLLGLPWFVAATVLALTHVDSLKLMSENTAPGERPLFVGVREQRMTTFIMSVLIGLSVFLTSILKVRLFLSYYVRFIIYTGCTGLCNRPDYKYCNRNRDYNYSNLLVIAIT